jgi:hypothetical protein
MSGSVHLNAPSYMPTLFGSNAQGSSLLAALSGYSTAAPTSPAATPEPTGDNASQPSARVAGDPQVQRDIAQFAQAVATAKTPAELLANPAALKVLLTASGLGDQVGQTALAKRALLSDPSQPGATVNQLADPRWLAATNTYAFASKGLAAVKDPATAGAIANGYAEVQWRRSLDQTTPGLSNALDFQRRAASITNVDQVLGDPTFRAVITTTLGIPAQAQLPSEAAWRQAISTRVDLTRFQDPTFVAQFAQRYLSVARLAADQTGSTATPSRTSQAARSAGLVV